MEDVTISTATVEHIGVGCVGMIRMRIRYMIIYMRNMGVVSLTKPKTGLLSLIILLFGPHFGRHFEGFTVGDSGMF